VRRRRDAARRFADLVGAALFAAMFGAFLVQVFMRYVLNRPLGWSDEVSVILYVWGIFWAGAFMTADRDHVAFDLLYAELGGRAKRMVAVAGTLVVAGLFAAALPATADYVRFMGRERTAVLGIRFDLVFGCFLVFLAAVAARAVARLVRLLGARWRDAL
jgi:TRAP-type C4-dicarboxylate transport system permease small subunit